MAMETTSPGVEKAVHQLNSFLRGEISAVETYRIAEHKLNDPSLQAALKDNMASHQRRADELRRRIQQMGGQPAGGSGPWGAFVKLTERGASEVGAKAALAVLEEGEDHGLADYKRDLEQVDVQTRSFVQTQLLPEQERTHARLSSLKRSIH